MTWGPEHGWLFIARVGSAWLSVSQDSLGYCCIRTSCLLTTGYHLSSMRDTHLPQSVLAVVHCVACNVTSESLAHRQVY